MFFRKKKLTEVNSDEYEKLSKKIVSIVGDIDIMSNNIALLDSIVKSNRARISKIKVDKIMEETEDNKKDDVKYL